MMTPPPTALFFSATGAPARAGAETDSFDAAGAAEATVGTATSEAAANAAVAIFETRIIYSLFLEFPNLMAALARIASKLKPQNAISLTEPQESTPLPASSHRRGGRQR
jgi:hypothetical protein